MAFKEALGKVLDISGYALFFAVAMFISYELYFIYLQSLSAIPVLIALLGVFGILSYYKYNKKLKARYFIIAYFSFIVLPTFVSMFLNSPLFILLLIIFDFTIPIFIFLIDEDEDKFMKKQRLLVRVGIDVVEGVFALAILFIFATSIILVFNTIIPQQTPFLPNITASVYYSSSSSTTFKPLKDPSILNFFYLFNPTNQTEIKGIAKVIKVDNVSYENSFRAYCLNAQTTKFWMQDCITYQPYYNLFSNSQNYELQTEIWQGQKSLLNVDEIIPNSSIYKNQTFYLKLVVENNSEIAYETNNGRTEYIKVELPKNQSFGVITDNSSMNTEIHEESYYAINTGLLGFYALNTTLTSLSGNFKYEDLAIFDTPVLYGTGNFSFPEKELLYTHISFVGENNSIYKVDGISNNSVMTTTYYYPMNALQLKDMQSIENGTCKIYDYGLMYGIPPFATENWSKTSNTILTNLTMCNSNETFGEFLKSINKTI